MLENEVGAWNELALQKYNIQIGDNATLSNMLKVQITSADHGKHIAQKPLQLMELLISLVTIEGQVGLDPFMGSGTTCLAAKKLNRHYIGIDIDPQSVRVANERLDLPLQIEITF